MACNQLSMVANQFKTRHYEVGDIDDHEDRWSFKIMSNPEGHPVDVSVTFIPSDDNPHGDLWHPANVHWGTNRTTYSGTVEQSAAALADTIVSTIATDNLQ
jgi:hypothetical protein